MSATTVRLVHVYPEHFDINGDSGNALTLRKRLEWAGFDVELIEPTPAGGWPSETPDIVLIGGGTLAAQRAALAPLRAEAARLSDWIAAGVPLLAVAGGLQLALSRIRFPGDDDTEHDGLGIFAGLSEQSPAHRTGPLVLESPEHGRLFGYLNLAQTAVLDAGQQPFARVLHGEANGAATTAEAAAATFDGAVNGTAIGSHSHGPLLPRNPGLADHLITTALARRGIDGYALGEKHLRVDDYARRAREAITARLKLADAAV